MPAPAAPRPASTVILCRPVERAAFEVLLLKRSGKSGFMAGAHVFPGGRVDDADYPAAGAAAHGALLDGMDARTAGAYLRAAVRETREEAGIDLDIDALRPFAWWITPEEEPKRFDTRFFLAPVPAATEAHIDDHEAVAFAWLSPSAALDAYARGELALAPPTLCTLEDLREHRDVDAAAAAVTRPLRAICPRMIARDDSFVLALPGDELHDVKERVFAHRTRVVFVDGKFISRNGP